ncbi:MAG: hypothetical protein J3R72DRAFT_437867 [Linnemannia gamsii]|nr:MAG: hypothetical protein J3R72DRAFT_437867 [Linnemannia gamsii]
MARKPLLHAFFHSIVSLGYIPFALSSVLLSSSSPFVSIHPIAIILIAFTPPLLIFPLLCFSYRFLERFECISLTVQRARTYVMVAGSGLCLLMGMHLVMIYGVGNGHNTAYNRMVYGAPPTRAVAGGGSGGGGPSAAEFKRMAQLIPLSSSSSSSLPSSLPSGVVLNSQLVEPSQVLPQEQGQEQDNTAAAPTTNKAEVPPTISTLDDLDSTLTQAQAGGGVGEEIQLPLSIISSFFMSLPDSDQGSNTAGAASSSFIMDPVKAMLTNMERVAAATGVTGEPAAVVEEMMRDANSVASGMRGMDAAADVGMRKRAVPLAAAPGGEGVVFKSPVPIHLYPSASASALDVSKDSIDSIEQQQPQLPQLQDKRDSVVGGQTALKVDGQEEDTPLSPQTDPVAHLPSTLPFAIPQLDPFSILLMGAPEQQQHQGGEVQQEKPLLYWSKPSPYYPPADNNNPSSSSVLFDHQDPNRTLGYNLITVHWLLYLTAQSILIFLLVTLFLGVLILTEFVLDREDEDLVQIQYLYWSRVVGIAFATIVSAVHGSLLSGYVLLEEHTDWIAKASVGAIVIYWCGMTWIMNRVTGPLPY